MHELFYSIVLCSILTVMALSSKILYVVIIQENNFEQLYCKMLYR